MASINWTVKLSQFITIESVDSNPGGNIAASAERIHPRGATYTWVFAPFPPPNTSGLPASQVPYTGNGNAAQSTLADLWVMSQADVDAVDVAMGSRFGDPNWNPAANAIGNNVIDASDRMIVASAMGNYIPWQWYQHGSPVLFINTGRLTSTECVGERIQDGVIKANEGPGKHTGDTTREYTHTIQIGGILSGLVLPEFTHVAGGETHVRIGVTGFYPTFTTNLAARTIPPQIIIGSWPEFSLITATHMTHIARMASGYTYTGYIRDIGWIPFIAGEQEGQYSCDTLAYTAQMAVTNYSNCRFVSLVEHGGVLYGSNANGLFTLEYAALEDEPIDGSATNIVIDAHFTIKRSEFNDPFFKNILYTYLNLKSNGTISVSLTEEGNTGRTTQYMTSTTDEWTSRKVTHSRGYRGHYWSMRIGNVEGADFHMDYAEILFNEQLRRAQA